MDHAILYSTAIVIVAAFGIAVYFYYKYYRILKNNLRNLTGAIHKIMSGTYDPESQFFNDEQYKDVYMALTELWGWQKEIDTKQKSLIDTTNALTNNIEMRHMLERLMPQIVKSTESNCGVFYLLNKSTNKLELRYSIGFSKSIYGEFDISVGEGFIGTAARTGETIVIKDLPEDTVFMTKTFLGRIIPKNIMVVPISNAENTLGVLALASVKEYSKVNINEIDFLKKYVAMAVSNSLIYESSKRLAGELKFQNQLIADLNTELEKNISDRTILMNTIIDSIKYCGIYAIDLYGTVIAWNLECSKLFSVKKEDALGKSIYELYKVFDIEKSVIDFQIDYALKNGGYHEQSWKTRQDGTSVFLDVDIYAVYNEMKEVTGMTGAIKDLTAMKNSQRSMIFERYVIDEIMVRSRRLLLIADETLAITKTSRLLREKLGECEGTPVYSICEDSEKVRSFIMEDMEGERNMPVTIKKTGEKVMMNIIFVDGSDSDLKRILIFLD